jgi:hypothetical protein
MRQFNHKNNHVFKPREYNRLKFPTMSFNMLNNISTFPSNTHRVGGKKGTISTFN